jgi:hypothetical protein
LTSSQGQDDIKLIRTIKSIHDMGVSRMVNDNPNLILTTVTTTTTAAASKTEDTTSISQLRNYSIGNLLSHGFDH